MTWRFELTLTFDRDVEMELVRLLHKKMSSRKRVSECYLTAAGDPRFNTLLISQQASPAGQLTGLGIMKVRYVLGGG
jgi:hypothetical protein